jgi:hypothetical protein
MYYVIELNYYITTNRSDPNWLPPPASPIDFCYFQKEHLDQVNDLLQKCFWPGIDGKPINLLTVNSLVISI